MTPLSRGLFFAMAVLFLAFLYKVGEAWNAFLWPQRYQNSEQSNEEKAKKSS
jgi:hypothetical protein